MAHAAWVKVGHFKSVRSWVESKLPTFHSWSITVQFHPSETPICRLTLKIEFLPRSDKVEGNHMERCNMDSRWIEAFLSVLKYLVLLEYLVTCSSYKTACSLVHRIANYIQPKNDKLELLLDVTNLIGNGNNQLVIRIIGLKQVAPERIYYNIKSTLFKILLSNESNFLLFSK